MNWVGRIALVAVMVIGCDREPGDWIAAYNAGTVEAIDRYLQTHPTGAHVAEAKEARALLQRQIDYRTDFGVSDKPGDEHFLDALNAYFMVDKTNNVISDLDGHAFGGTIVFDGISTDDGTPGILCVSHVWVDRANGKPFVRPVAGNASPGEGEYLLLYQTRENGSGCAKVMGFKPGRGTTVTFTNGHRYEFGVAPDFHGDWWVRDSLRETRQARRPD